MKWWISQGSWWSEGIYPYSFIRFKYSYSTCLIKKGSLISFYFNVFWFLKLGAAWHHSGKRGPSLPYKERDRSEDLRHAGGVYYGKWIHSNLCIIIRSWEVTKGESMKRLPWQQNAHYSMWKKNKNNRKLPISESKSAVNTSFKYTFKYTGLYILYKYNFEVYVYLYFTWILLFYSAL